VAKPEKIVLVGTRCVAWILQSASTCQLLPFQLKTHENEDFFHGGVRQMDLESACQGIHSSIVHTSNTIFHKPLGRVYPE
jgi:hypothetical protein